MPVCLPHKLGTMCNTSGTYLRFPWESVGSVFGLFNVSEVDCGKEEDIFIKQLVD